MTHSEWSIAVRSTRLPHYLRPMVLSGLVLSGMTTAVLGQGSAQVPTPGLTQSDIGRFAIQEYPGLDVMVFAGTFAPAATPGRHRHPGPELVYVVEGTGILLQDGREPVELRPGMTVLSEPEFPGGSFTHEIRNLSATEPLKTYVVLLLAAGEAPALPPE